MAYKIQVGTARLSGSVIYAGNLVSDDNGNISGSHITSSNDIIAHGAASGGGFVINNAGTVTANGSIYASGSGGNKIVLITAADGTSNNGEINLYNQTDETKMATIGSDATNGGSLLLASTASATTLVSIIGGTLSGSGNFSLGGDLTSSVNTTINGNLTIQGTSVDLNVDEFRANDVIIELGSGSNGDGNALIFGATSAQSGGRIKYIQASNTISFTDGDGNNSINISASTFYGLGSSITNVASSGLTISLTSHNSNGTVQPGLNLVDISGGSVALTMPTGSGVDAGQEYIVKISNYISNNTCTITKSGTDDIDGVNSITLESQNAAVSLVYNNSGSYKIF